MSKTKKVAAAALAVLALAAIPSTSVALSDSGESVQLARREAYFHWAKAVVDGLRGANAALEAAFDTAYEQGLRAIRTAA